MVLLQLSEYPLYLGQNFFVQIIATLVFLPFFRWLYIRFTHISISYLPGPPKSHWLFGNLPDLDLREVGVSHLSWQGRYGSVLKIYGFFGVRIS